MGVRESEVGVRGRVVAGGKASDGGGMGMEPGAREEEVGRGSVLGVKARLVGVRERVAGVRDSGVGVKLSPEDWRGRDGEGKEVKEWVNSGFSSSTSKSGRTAR